MKIAVLSLTRDRLDYTKHCFGRLRELAGCEYDHYVVDNGSTDDTAEWLVRQDVELVALSENIGVNRALNLLLDEALNPADYDVIVKFDNDCELVTPNTLRDVCSVVAPREQVILSPRIHGLRNPPSSWATMTTDDGHVFDATAVIGGIFSAVPAWVFADGYRHNEEAPPWGDEDARLCRWFREQGGFVGYLHGYNANHYRTTDGQHDDFPDYFARRVDEGGPE